MKNYYDILNVSRNSSPQDIKKSYYKLAKEFHPDKTNNNFTKNEKFIDIQEAYQVLSNEEKRRTYDISLDDNKFFDDFSNIFNNFSYEENKKSQVSYDVHISIKEYVKGISNKEFTVDVNIPCTICDETGIHEHFINTRLCTFCGGTGLDINLPIFNCSKCHGKTYEILKNIKCYVCNGYGHLKQKQTINLDIPKLPKSEFHIIKDDIRFNIKRDFDNDITDDGKVIIIQKINPIQWLIGHEFKINTFENKYTFIKTDGAFDLSEFFKVHDNIVVKFVLLMNKKQIKNLVKVKPIFEKLFKQKLFKS